MSLLKTIMEAQGGKILEQVSRNFGLDAGQATTAIGHLLPSLTKGLKNNVQKDNGLDGLLDAIRGGNHGRYLDEPSLFGKKETVNDGNSILGHILGSKDRSRQVAKEAAQKTGIDVSILKKLLPMVATMTMGGLNKQAKSNQDGLGDLLESIGRGEPVQQRRKQSSILDGLLDADNDGSVLDDLMGMAKKFL